jgi:phage-related protein
MNSDRVTAGSGRTRRLTESGKHLFVTQNKKRRVDILKGINLQSEHIQQLMATNTRDLLDLRNEYKKVVDKVGDIPAIGRGAQEYHRQLGV